MQLHCFSSAWWSVPCLRPNTRKYRINQTRVTFQFICCVSGVFCVTLPATSGSHFEVTPSTWLSLFGRWELVLPVETNIRKCSGECSTMKTSVSHNKSISRGHARIMALPAVRPGECRIQCFQIRLLNVPHVITTPHLRMVNLYSWNSVAK
jgi:hypothetical protein